MAVAYVHFLGWTAPAFDLWVDHEGNHWQIDSHASEDVSRVLVANKIDLPNRIVSEEMGKQLAQEYGLTYFETSAMTGHNINELFYYMAKTIIKDKASLTSVGQSP